MATLGSLFDGSGGFPLAGRLNGITPVWASEIEPFPIRVTSLQFPEMKHLGSVLDVDGSQVEPVDIITFGSPCQDLSVAGKQAGIHEGERSNLFFEAIRIIKEMREHDKNSGRTGIDIRPRFAVWENVPGAFSSNKGKDFQAVLQAFADIEGTDISIPEPPKGKWNHAGCIVGDGWSIAWRVYDAQFWGVPQRRKRIYLVADFAGECAGEILFKPESLRRDPETSGKKRQETAGDPERSPGGSSKLICVATQQGGAEVREDDIAPTLTAAAGMSGNNQPYICFEPGQAKRDGSNSRFVNGMSPTLRAEMGDNQLAVCYSVENHPNDSRVKLDERNTVQTLSSRMGTGGNNVPLVLDGRKRKYIIRRLTPLECGRLQGFPDDWCDGAKGSDSAIYKMWGNGIALPCAVDVIRRIAEEIEKTR